MVFSSTEFLMIFLAVVLALYYFPFIRSRQYRNIILLISSIGFYAWGEPVFVFLMLFSIVINWAAGLLIDKNQGTKRKAYFLVALIWDIALLFVFKYLVFVLDNIGVLLNRSFDLQITLPIGISFYTFQIISYIADLYMGKVAVQKNILNLGLYISMFPQLIAGPIVRYQTVAEEIESRTENWKEFGNGLYRFIYGLGKKVIISNNVAILVDRAFSASDLSVSYAWMGAAAYLLQLYFDFSGYSDMAIGLGRMFGFHFDENFRYPYVAASVTEFWRRWHLSLSTWFRDYVYIPLGGNRVSPKRHTFNLFVVWVCTGVWHGANWTFILWGLIFFVVQYIEKRIGIEKIPRIIGHFYTLLVVAFCMVLFRADSISCAYEYIKRMLGIGGGQFLDSSVIGDFRQYWVYLLIGIIGSLPIKEWIIKKKLHEKPAVQLVNTIYVFLIFLISIAFIVSSNYNPFIYFNF